MVMRGKTFFEEKGEELLKIIGMTKSEFGRRMGVGKQNVNALFRTKNLETIYKASTILEVPFIMLILLREGAFRARSRECSGPGYRPWWRLHRTALRVRGFHTPYGCRGR